MRRFLRGAPLVVGSLAAIGLFSMFALGGDDAEDKIKETIEEVATSKDPTYCYERVTQAYLEEATGLKGAAATGACESAAAQDEPTADSVEVADIAVHGSTATAAVTYEGTALDGSTVEVGLVELDGEWLLDHRLGFAEIDRAGMRAGIEESLVAPPTRLSPDGAECVARRITGLSDAAIERVLLSPNTSDYFAAVVECDRGSLLNGLGSENAAFGDPPALVSCVRSELDRLEDAELVALMKDPVGYTRIGLECDRAEFLAAYGRAVEEGGASADAADCVVSKLDELSDDELARLAVDDSELDEIYPECGIGG